MRLLGMWDSIDPSKALWPLTSTIVLNLIRDRSRCAPRHDVVALLPEVESPHDVERAGLARIELDRVRRAMGHLSSRHRSVLMQELRRNDHSVATPAEKMLRMRARRKLRSILEKVSGLVAVRVRRIFELGDKVFALRDGAATTASCVLCLVLGAGGALVSPAALTPKASARPAPAAIAQAVRDDRADAAYGPIDGRQLRDRVAEVRREQAADRDRDASKTSSGERDKKGSAVTAGGGYLPSVPIGGSGGQIPVSSTAMVSTDPDEVTPPDPGDAPTVEPSSAPEPPSPPPPPVDASTAVRPLVEATEQLLN